MYAVIHPDSRTVLSTHPTVAQALDAIKEYEHVDAVYGEHNDYDWMPTED